MYTLLLGNLDVYRLAWDVALEFPRDVALEFPRDVALELLEKTLEFH